MVEFKIGLTVRLKSGGPLMTISKASAIYGMAEENTWDCTWFDPKHELKNASFHQDTLELDEDGD